jgi:hypothetical protein
VQNSSDPFIAKRLKPAMRDLMIQQYERPNLVDVVVCESGCVRCKGQVFLDIAIHEGKSIRRDCAECGKFRCFAVWHGKVQSRTEPIK